MSIKTKIDGLRQIWKFDNRWELIYGRLFDAGAPTSIYKLNGLHILSDHAAGDANGAREILTTDIYRQFLPMVDTSNPLNILDIGANNGGFSLLLKLENIRIKKLAAVEFNPRTFSRLATNIETNFEDINVEILNAAVCSENRKVFVSADNSSTSDNIYSEPGDETGQTVEGITLDNLIERTFGSDPIDICKMDIESAEFEVFENPGHYSIRQCRNLIVEIHHTRETPRRNVIEKLVQLGFEEVNGDNKDAEGLHYVHFFRNLKA